MEIYQSMGFAAVAVGPYDLGAGLDFLLQSKRQGFPWMSANLLDGDGTPLFGPSTIHTLGSSRIGLIGLTGKTANLPPTVQLADYREVLQQEINRLSKKCKFLILLSSLTREENRKIIQNFPSIHVIISAQKNRGNVPARLNGNTILTQTMSKGKYQGVLTITPGTGSQWEKKKVSLATLENRLGSYDWQISRMKKRKELHTPQYLKKIQTIEKKRKRLLEQITKQKNSASANSTKEPVYSTFKGEFFALSRKVAETSHIQQAVATIKRKIKEHNQQLRTARATKLHSGQTAKTTKRKNSLLLGYHGCKECHEKQTDFWSTTDHASSFETLAKKEQHFNLDCIGCHVTTDKNPGQLNDTEKKRLLNLPSSLRLVGCESCHGPGQDHADDPENVKPGKIVEKTCLNCHTEERSDNFNFEEKLKAIHCPSGD